MVVLNPYHIEDFKNGNSQHTEVDVLAQSSEGDLFTIEMQLIYHQAFISRTLFYACKTYTDQFGQVQAPEKNKCISLKPTYGIVIHDFDLFQPKASAVRSFSFREDDGDSLAQQSLYHINDLNLVYFNLQADSPEERIQDWQRFSRESPSR